ncbi:protein FAR1-RELATED SEQUENCE 5-like isoform X3 [Papaver somniferum]|uniref:protein FAR1-RELATED SEQUENCE 5-like isoform X3 n=1 Tax=Papaver somniferum TaxID=3469 RepID=UPI000E6F4A41|nr:protein FAR1-RELATED SEQUENCE 5-like isoform X3 [Papaver somniferum]
MRTDCKAMMRIALDIKRKMWYVNTFVHEHNHEMVSPKKRALMRSNKYMPLEAKSMAEAFNKNRLPVVQVDGEGRAANLFWVDARSRMAYIRFGDVVTFDTTYKTNKYSMPFAPFTGKNHHHQSITFGFALLGDETEPTFIWLFKTWLEAMGGTPPVSILTDQDQAMTNAVATVFPGTRHRFCLWHIKKKFGEKLSHVLFKKSKFKRTVKAVIRNTYTVEDFVNQWQSMLVEFSLTENEWLKDLYDIREKWIPVYNRSVLFFAGMNTTQRSESINSFFDHYVNSKTSLREFAESCDQAFERMYVREREEDYKSIHTKRIFASQDLLVRHASKIFTRVIFNKVHAEFNASLRYRSKIVEVDGDEHSYTVYWKVGDTVEQFPVKINEVTKKGTCGRQNFEFKGIPCRHLHHILVSRLYVEEIPSYFVMERWKKNANKSVVLSSDHLEIKDDKVGI